jgi:hypothetical protein
LFVWVVVDPAAAADTVVVVAVWATEIILLLSPEIRIPLSLALVGLFQIKQTPG